MKKSFFYTAAIVAALTLMFCSFTATATATDHAITVTDYRAGENDRHIQICAAGQELRFLSTDCGVPFIDTQNRVQVPAREFAEAIGGVVQYSDAEKTVTISNLTGTVVFQVGSNQILCGGTAREMDTTAQNVGGQIYVPLRALSEALGFTVEYRAEKAASADCRISRDKVVSGEMRQQLIGVPATAPEPLNSKELDMLIELYNQMCMVSPRYAVDRFDTVNSYSGWVYLTMQDGAKVDLCLRMQEEWEVRCFTGPEEKDNFVMHSPDLYAFIARLYDSEWTPAL